MYHKNLILVVTLSPLKNLGRDCTVKKRVLNNIVRSWCSDTTPFFHRLDELGFSSKQCSSLLRNTNLYYLSMLFLGKNNMSQILSKRSIQL